MPCIKLKHLKQLAGNWLQALLLNGYLWLLVVFKLKLP